jgi:hypothetical protein
MRKKVNAQMNDRGDISLPSVMYTNMYVCVYIPSTLVHVRVKMLKTYNIYYIFICHPGTRVCCVCFIYFYFLIVLFECFILSNFTYC